MTAPKRKPARRCGTCRWYEPKGPLRGGYIYPCAWPAPATELPDSITTHHAYPGGIDRRWMQHNEGTTCPTWEAKP